MEKLYTWSKNGMKMIINTDFKEFNKQTNCISSGNAIANTQYSNYIRPYKETKGYGFTTFQEGHLQNYDLKFFNKVTQEIRDILRNQEKSVCLYEFFIYRNHVKDVIGHIIVKDNEVIYKKVYNRLFLNYDRLLKRQNVLDYCEKIILKKC